MPDCSRLDHLGNLTITGADAAAFAQSQFTSDFDTLAVGEWRPGAWCDSKGKVLIVMLAARRENGVELVMPASQIDSTLTRLQMFAIGRRVEFGVHRRVCGCRGVIEESDALSFDPTRKLRLDDESCRPDDEASRHWLHDDLDARFPWLSENSAGRHLPQSLGLEALNGLSYSKGCYPGQEVIARVHYRGKVNYRVVRVAFNAAAPAPGSVLRLEDGRRAGEMLWSLSAEHGSDGLAVVSTEIENRSLVVAELNNERISGQVSV